MFINPRSNLGVAYYIIIYSQTWSLTATNVVHFWNWLANSNLVGTDGDGDWCRGQFLLFTFLIFFHNYIFIIITIFLTWSVCCRDCCRDCARTNTSLACIHGPNNQQHTHTLGRPGCGSGKSGAPLLSNIYSWDSGWWCTRMCIARVAVHVSAGMHRVLVAILPNIKTNFLQNLGVPVRGYTFGFYIMISTFPSFIIINSRRPELRLCDLASKIDKVGTMGNTHTHTHTHTAIASTHTL